MGLFFSRNRPEPGIEIRGLRWSFGGDWYHTILRTPWWFVLLVIAGTFMGLNFVFALGYRLTGGIAGARPGHFSDLFFFSVQTMGTIGYGSMYPAGLGAHLLVTVQALVGILLVALSTGIVFAKFSVVRARARFANDVVICPVNGVPTVMFRVGHERSSFIVDVTTRVILTRTEHTTEGVLMYRSYDLKLERDHAVALSRTWMVMHRITPESPLSGATPESFAKDEIELTVTLSGTDETSGQLLHARKRYLDSQVRWGARHADMLSEGPGGLFILDMDCFDQIVATEPTATFPFPAPRLAGAERAPEKSGERQAI